MSSHQAPQTVAAANAADETALTWSQELLWTGQRLHPESPLYNMALAFEIDGAINVSRFESAFRSVVNRSDALRTTLSSGESPMRCTREPYSAPVEFVDFSDRPDPQASSDEWIKTRVRRSLDAAVQLFDCALLRLSEHRHIWYLNQHHLITDAWSTALVFKAVSDEYVQLADVSFAHREPLPPYSGFARYLEHFAGTSPAAKAGAHWQSVRELGLSPLPLYGKKRAASESTRAERITLHLGPERSARILSLGSHVAQGLTTHASAFNVFAGLVAGFASRVSGQTDVAIGTLSHNRPTAVLKETIGVFVELFPFRVKVEGDDSFTHLLTKVRSESTSLLRYALPGVSDATLNRSLNVVLNYMTAAFSDFAGISTRFRLVHSGHSDATHDLRVQVHNFGDTDGFTVHMDFSAEKFTAGERALAAGHFLAFIDAALTAPDAPLNSLSLLGAGEENRLREEFSGAQATTVPSFIAPATVVEAIRASVAHDPDAEAIVFSGSMWTYGDLYARALGIAEMLDEIGVRGRRVALAIPRSAESVAAILGILEAGGTYVPLDPNAPAERNAFILKKTGAVAVVVSADGLAAQEVPIVDTRVAQPLNRAALEAQLNSPRPTPTASELAYILFTSGSTGKPKGVMVTHESLAHYAHWAADEYLNRDGHARFALFTPLTFDLTVTSIFAPLVSGRSIVVYPDKGEAVDTAVLDVFEDDAVDVVKLTPSHLALVVGGRQTERIRTLILGGEDLRRDLAVAGLSLVGGSRGGRVANEYGPTEATVACTLHVFEPDADASASVPIGRPLPGATIAIVGPDGSLVPTGVVGEITIGGPGVAQGYLDDPAQTAERFVPDPLDHGNTAYRTGDAGRWQPDGTLEFLGRLDRQIKIHGVRIEPAEIEAVLGEHPNVSNCVVVNLHEPTQRPAGPARRCIRCGISSDHPEAKFGSGEGEGDDVCSLCAAFDGYRGHAGKYFGRIDELKTVLTQRAQLYPGEFDCLMLLSGGKDSSYALCKLVEQGFRVLAVTLDNGYISDGAKENVRRVTRHLGVPHEFMTSPVMNQIFVDSLQRFSNVCQGCFKTLYTLAFNIALTRGIPSIVTGLSRGQFFETRLTEELFFGQQTTRKGLELVVLDARKAYHRADDYVNSLLDTRAFADDAVFERVEFVDFYRYCDVDLDEMLAYLDQTAPWIRPSDTGRSTNCLINDVGIHVHQLERGFHNYALPYSWDVRMGHKQRDAALEELDDEIDVSRVEHILNELGYTPRPRLRTTGPRLTAFVTLRGGATTSEFRHFLEARLPSYMIPSRFIQVDHIPLTDRGKADVSALEALSRASSSVPVPVSVSAPPSTPTERVLARLWSEALGVPACGIDDNFFEAGGDSITAIRVAARANTEGLGLTANHLFRHQTIRELARVVDDASRLDRGPNATEPNTATNQSTAPSRDTLSKIAQLLEKADRSTRSLLSKD